MPDPRKDLPRETFECGRDVEDGTNYLAGQYDVLRFSHVQRCLENGIVPSVLFADDHGYRAVAHDRTGDRSELYKDCHSDVARAGRKALDLPKTRHYWNCGRPLTTVLLDAETIIERIARLHHYFGDENALISYEQWGELVTLPRPPQMSARHPASVKFIPLPPPELMHLGVIGAKAAIAAAIANFAASTSQVEPPETSRPLYDGADDDEVKQAYDEYETFCDDHYDAYQALRRGERDVTFPAGTIFWRLRANVNVAVAAAR